MTTSMFAERIGNIPESFIREILKVSTQENMISFAGGLPNPDFFPFEKIAEAAEKVLRLDGCSALQYAPTEGYLPLRAYLAERQSRKGEFAINPEDVVILNGSQQGLDLVGKLFLNPLTNILLEDPSYLGAIQAFSAYEPRFHVVPLQPKGPSLPEFRHITRRVDPKFFYCIPNFQNPTGYSYDTATRIALIESQLDSPMLWIEDNPYGEIRFSGDHPPDFHSIIPHKTIHLGSFSKILSPGLRLGWATGPKEIIKKMTVAKQASDLHSNNLAQRIVYCFLTDNSLDNHISNLCDSYKRQATTMHILMQDHFPKSVKWSEPQGGMFIWVTLPDSLDANALLKKSIEENVLFVPGNNFYTDSSRGKNTIRMNFSNPSSDEMVRGIATLGKIMTELIG